MGGRETMVAVDDDAGGGADRECGNVGLAVVLIVGVDLD